MLLALLSVTLRWRPQIVHSHSTFAGAIARGLSVTGLLPPIIYCPHGWAFEIEQRAKARTFIKWVERKLSHHCERIIAISEAEFSQGVRAGIDVGKISHVPNGIHDIEPGSIRVAPWEDARLKVLFVGRLDRQKGLDVLLAAAKGLEGITSIRIVGESVASIAGAQQELPHVKYLGWMSHADVAAQISSCDVAVMPSRWEGFGLVAIEAMRAAKPVIASAVGGLAEVVHDGVTGALFAAGDHAQLRHLLTDYASRNLVPIGLAARERFLDRYTSDKTEARVYEVYLSVLGKKASIATSTA